MNTVQKAVTGSVIVVLLGTMVMGMFGTQFPMLGGNAKGHSASMGYIDVQKVFEGSSRGKVLMSSFQETLGAKQAEIQRLGQEAEGLKNQIESLARSGKRAQAQALIPRFQAAQQKFLQAREAGTAELNKAQADVDKAFMQQLKTVADVLRKDEHLDVIQAVDVNKTLSYEPTMDLTQKAITRYNEMFPPEGGVDKTLAPDSLKGETDKK